MPYILDKQKEKYLRCLRSARQIIESVDDPQQQAEMVAWFAKRVVTILMDYDCHGMETSFESLEFNGQKKAMLKGEALAIGGLIKANSDMCNLAGDLNYNLSYMIWHIQKDARYGHRAYLKEMLWEIYTWVAGPPARKKRHVRGAISDVIDENYRRNTAFYEDSKIKENGDIWDYPEESS